MLSRRERGFVLAGIGGFSGIAWGKLLLIAGTENAGGGVAGAISGLVILSGPNLAEPLSVAAPGLWPMIRMNAAAVLAIVLPAATLLMLSAAMLCKQRWPAQDVLPRVMLFFAGYVLAWVLAALPLSLLAWKLEQLRPAMVAYDALGPILGAILLLVAGLYQFTPIKQASLSVCRAPGLALATWPGDRLRDAFRAGLSMARHGLTSDWALILLLLVGGLANPAWVFAVAFFIATEKLFSPEGDFGRWAGLMISLGGMAVLIGVTF